MPRKTPKPDADVMMRMQILGFMRGVRGERDGVPVTEEQVCAQFSGADPSFVKARLLDLCGYTLTRAVSTGGVPTYVFIPS